MREPPSLNLSPSQVPEAMWQEILPKVLKVDLNSVLASPEHLELFLLAHQKVPAKLEKLMGSVDLFSDENIPRCEGGGWVGSLGPRGCIWSSTDLWYGLGVSLLPWVPWPLPVQWLPPESPLTSSKDW